MWICYSFITYRSARHLDNKHTVFGRVVGGLETLDKMEKVEVDSNDRPKEDIIIQVCQIFVDPYDEVDQLLKAEREAAATASETKAKQALSKQRVKDDVSKKTFKEGVGKYINPVAQKRTFEEEEELSETQKKKLKQTKQKSDLGNFSSWWWLHGNALINYVQNNSLM